MELLLSRILEENSGLHDEQYYQQLAKRLESECAILENKNYKFKIRTYAAAAVGAVSISLFFLLLRLKPFQEDPVTQYYLFPLVVGGFSAAVFISERANKFRITLSEKWALRSFAAYKISYNSLTKNDRIKANRQLTTLIRRIKSAWDIDELKMDAFGSLVNPVIKLLKKIEGINEQLKQDDEKNVEVAQRHLLDLTDFFLNPSEEGFAGLLSINLPISIGQTLTVKSNLSARKLINNPKARKGLILSGIVGLAIGSYFFSLYVVGVGKDAAYGGAIAVIVGYISIDKFFKKD